MATEERTPPTPIERALAIIADFARDLQVIRSALSADREAARKAVASYPPSVVLHARMHLAEIEAGMSFLEEAQLGLETAVSADTRRKARLSTAYREIYGRDPPASASTLLLPI